MTNETTQAATEKWEAASETGFAAKYEGDESAAITTRIFAEYEAGIGIGTIAKDLGISVMSVKSRMLTVLLREAYDEIPMIQDPITEEWHNHTDEAEAGIDRRWAEAREAEAEAAQEEEEEADETEADETPMAEAA